MIFALLCGIAGGAAGFLFGYYHGYMDARSHLTHRYTLTDKDFRELTRR